MKKRALSILLIAAMCASFATGCKDDNGSNNDPNANVEKPDDEDPAGGRPEHKPVEGSVLGVGGLNEFDSTLFNFIEENGYAKENYMISPTSFRAALCLAASGAKGETQSQLLDAMDFESEEDMNIWYTMVYNETADFMDSIDEEKASIEEYESDPDMADLYHVSGEPDGAFRLVNSIWANSDGNPEFTQEYIDLVKERYDAPATSLPGADLAPAVNEWVANATDNLITNLADDLSNVNLVLVNALYLRAGWVDSFSESLTKEDNFTTIDGDITTKEYMCKQDEFRYYEDENGKLIIIPLDYGVKAAFVLGQIDDVDKALSEAETWDVDLKLPKIDLESNFGSEELIGYLQSQGVDLAFDPFGSGDFSTMSDIPVYISDIIQKTRIKTDEDGLEAAAVTAIMMTEAAAALEPEEKEIKEFYATEPFKFFVYTELENEENEIFFYGQIVK